MGKGRLMPKSQVQESIERRKQESLLRWSKREQFVAGMRSNGLVFRKGADSGPASGIAYVKCGSREISVILATGRWALGEEEGQGLASLVRRVKRG